MIKDLLIDFLGSYSPLLSPINLTLQSSDALSEIVLSVTQSSVNWLWVGMYVIFITLTIFILKLLVSALCIAKR